VSGTSATTSRISTVSLTRSRSWLRRAKARFTANSPAYPRPTTSSHGRIATSTAAGAAAASIQTARGRRKRAPRRARTRLSAKYETG
jgi:hypothetical protein